RPAKEWTPAQVKKLIDEGPYTAKAAATAGLIDGLAYPQQVQDKAKTALKADRVKVVRNYGAEKSEEADLSNPLSLFTKLFSSSKAAAPKTGDKIALIYATGVIASGKSTASFFGEEVMGSTTMIEAIRQAEQDKSVKAIVLRVDSPGGSALAS